MRRAAYAGGLAPHNHNPATRNRLARPQTDKSSILVVLSVAKDLTERSDTDRVAGVRSFATLRTTEKVLVQREKVDAFDVFSLDRDPIQAS
ncbi:hypothetical protein BH10PSE6_BH10PSE6_47740 [soil metagenome]